MTERPARFLFDECVGLPVMGQIARFVERASHQVVEIHHVLDMAPVGTRDEDWLPSLKDGGWTVISADGGRTPNKNRGKKLPRLCREYGVTLVLLSPKVHNRKSFDKARTIISVWPRLVEIATDESNLGRRYMIEPLNADNLGVGRVVERS